MPAAPRRPAASTAKLRSSRRASSAGVIAGTRAAASSIASAIPSSRRTTAATAAAFCGGHRETGLDRGRALGEQPHRLRLRDRRQVGAGAGHRQRRHRHQPLPLDPQALAAGRQDHQPLTRPRKVPGQRRRPVEQMLAVIEHQQQLLAAQELHQRLAGALAGPGGHREHRRDRIIHPGRVADRRQLTQPRAITEPRRHLRGGLQRQPGLAHPARPGQRHHPRLAQRGRGLLQLAGRGR